MSSPEDAAPEDFVLEERLHEAISDRDVDKINSLLEGSDSVPDVLRETEALHCAAGCGDISIVQFLLDLGAEVDQFNHEKLTPLSKAVAEGHKDVAQLLIDRGADVSAGKDYGYTPLMHCAAYGRAPECRATFDLLVENGADIHQPSRDPTNLLKTAAWAGNQVIAEHLLERGFELDLRTALLLDRPEEALDILQTDPDAVAETYVPVRLLQDAIIMVSDLAKRHRPPEDRIDTRGLKSEQLYEDTQTVFLKHRALFEKLIVLGVPVVTNGSAFCDAAMLAHPCFAQFLLDHGFNVNAAGQIGPFIKVIPMSHKYCPEEIRAVIDKALALARPFTPPAETNPLVRRYIEMLDDSDSKVRSRTIVNLQGFGLLALPALDALKKSLDDEDPLIRAGAQATISGIEDDILQARKK